MQLKRNPECADLILHNPEMILWLIDVIQYQNEAISFQDWRLNCI